MMKWHLTSVQSDWQSRRGELHKLNQTVEHNYVKSVDKVYVLVTETPGTAELLQFLLHVVACGGGGGADDVLFKSTSFLLGIYSTFVVML